MIWGIVQSLSGADYLACLSGTSTYAWVRDGGVVVKSYPQILAPPRFQSTGDVVHVYTLLTQYWNQLPLVVELLVWLLLWEIT